MAPYIANTQGSACRQLSKLSHRDKATSRATGTNMSSSFRGLKRMTCWLDGCITRPLKKGPRFRQQTDRMSNTVPVAVAQGNASPRPSQEDCNDTTGEP